MDERFVCHADRCPRDNSFHKNSTIVELPDGDLLAAWMASTGAEGGPDQDIYGARLPAGADAWADPRLLVGVDDRALGSPVLFAGPSDDLWLTAPQMYGNWVTGSRLTYKRSPDWGHTWRDLELLHEKPGLYLKNKPLYLEAEDRWLLGSSTYRVDATPYFLVFSGEYNERSGDFPLLVGGEEIVQKEPDGTMGDHADTRRLIYPTATELDDGELLAYMRPNPPADEHGRLWETRSSDRGITWTRAEETDIPNPNAGFDLHRTRSGNHLLIVNPTEGRHAPEGRNTLALFMSEDDCETWPYQVLLEHEETDRDLRSMPDGERPEFTYGNIIQGSDGTIHLTYEVRRHAIKHVATTEEEIRRMGADEAVVPELRS